jgi:hypothetical protein
VQNLHCRWTQIPDVSGQKLPDDFGQIKQSATAYFVLFMQIIRFLRRKIETLHI